MLGRSRRTRQSTWHSRIRSRQRRARGPKAHGREGVEELVADKLRLAVQLRNRRPRGGRRTAAVPLVPPRHCPRPATRSMRSMSAGLAESHVMPSAGDSGTARCLAGSQLAHLPEGTVCGADGASRRRFGGPWRVGTCVDAGRGVLWVETRGDCCGRRVRGRRRVGCGGAHRADDCGRVDRGSLVRGAALRSLCASRQHRRHVRDTWTRTWAGCGCRRADAGVLATGQQCWRRRLLVSRLKMSKIVAHKARPSQSSCMWRARQTAPSARVPATGIPALTSRCAARS